MKSKSKAAPAWTVMPARTQSGKIQHAGTHKLRFRRVVVTTGKGRNELDRLRRLAALFNQKGSVPLPKVSCAADAPNPDHYLRDLSH